MKVIKLALPFLVSFCFYSTMAQRKISIKYEYDLELNPKNRDEFKRELSRVHYYDTSGFLNKIITYGKKSLVVDTVTYQREDGTEIVNIVANYPSEMKQIGRIENFSKDVGAGLSGTGYEIWNTNDTFHFENTYQLYSTGIYRVFTHSKIPYSSKEYYCDSQFREINDVRSFREYNDFGQIVRIRYLENDARGIIQQGMVKHLKYNQNGSLACDSMATNGKPFLIERYQYDHTGKLILRKKTRIFANEKIEDTIQYEYNVNGDLAKELEGNWCTEYLYEYY